MEKKLTSHNSNCVVKPGSKKHRGITPFIETPCEGKYISYDSKKSEEIPANKLFALFTADIIKEEVIFIR